MEFGFGVRAESTLCPNMRMSVQAYKSFTPVEFNVESNFGTPIIRFDDGTTLTMIPHPDGHYEYVLTVGKTAVAHVKKECTDGHYDKITL
jgi:hypothetical protein